jgi:aerobic-type carbon monoxide dehydrogenase small subunit (CoxS/CutS family)
MKDKSKPKEFSRRKFIKGVGTSLASTYAYTPGIAKITKKIEKETEDFIEGRQLLSLKVNGKQIRVKIKSQTTLSELLRDHLELTGTKVLCNRGECGGCTVLLESKAVYSCHMLALDAEGKEVITIEGLMKGEELHPIQVAFKEHDGLQCGFCTPGQIMSAQALLLKNPKPGRDDVLKSMSGNLCKCAAYPNILKSVLAATEIK